MYVTLLMDVEDLVAPEADTIAAECARILTDEGVQATLCVVGEKARLLLERGRQDVIQALRQHDIGIHTDLHSVHPTIVEYLAPCDWDEGVEEALRLERPGVEAIQTVFGALPSCWGGPGNTWGPQIGAALTRLGVPAFVYAHTRVPEGGVHRFGGLLAFPGGRALNDGGYHEDASAQQDREFLAAQLRQDRADGIFWQEVFLGHPTRILHQAFWDAPNFALGRNPPRAEWKPAPRKSQEDLQRALSNFRQGIQMLLVQPGLKFRTVREMNALLEPLPGTPLTLEEQQAVWPRIEANLKGMSGWPILPADCDLSRILALTQSRLSALERLPLHRLAQTHIQVQ